MNTYLSHITQQPTSCLAAKHAGYKYKEGPIGGLYWFRHVATGRMQAFTPAGQCLYDTSHAWGIMYRGKKLVPCN